MTYLFSAPGRTEICGNHTDHQHGCVLAGAVDLEITAEVQLSGNSCIRIFSDGYEPFSIDINDLSIHPDEVNTTAALVRGTAAAFANRGARLCGFDAEIHSTVLPGSGLSSSAAFEVLMGTIMNILFFEGRCSPVEIARIGQFAENTYFKKPCGLMDQTACAVGGLVYIDFADPSSPIVERLDFDLAGLGYDLCIIDSGADHTDLTSEYASMPYEMKAAAAVCGKAVLGDVNERDFYALLPRIRKEAGDRAVLRSIHFFDENRRVNMIKRAVLTNDIDAFLRIINESGDSSWKLLQNITPTGYTVHQNIAVCLTLAKKLLNGRGAARVHGGGLAGTIQAFVPHDMLEEFRQNMEVLLGEGCCHVLSIRPQGGMQIGFSK